MCGVGVNLKQNKRFLLFVFILAFMVRATVFSFLLSKECYLDFDSAKYQEVASQIYNGSGIVNSDGTSHFYRVPGYSLFLACCYKIFGKDDVAALWVQVLLAAFIPVLIFMLSLLLFPGHTMLAKTASLITVFNVGYIIFAGFLMTESLFCLFFLSCLLLFFSGNYLFLSGLLLGIASMMRPVGHYLVVVLSAFLLVQAGGALIRAKKTLLFVVGWLAVVGWWLLRNWLLTGYLFFHTLPGQHFMFFSAVSLDMQMNQTSYEQSYEKLFNKVWPTKIRQKEKQKDRFLYEIERCNIGQRIALQYYIKAPFLAIKRSVVQIIKTVVSPYCLFLFQNGSKWFWLKMSGKSYEQ